MFVAKINGIGNDLKTKAGFPSHSPVKKTTSRVSLCVTSICPCPVLDLIPSDAFKH